MTRVLILGAGGQLGRRLARTTPAQISACFLSRAECDVTNADTVRDAVDSFRPDVVINAAAYTAVDDAEAKEGEAFAVNAEGARNAALAAARAGSRVIHVSTDYVFDGEATVPYTPEDSPNPVNTYGRSKLEGEIAVRESNERWVIVRSSWLYDADGRNFVRTMLRKMIDGSPLRVVDDQVGSPTAAPGLASMLWLCAMRPEIAGIHHWANAGRASWYEFAVAIEEIALSLGLVERAVAIEPVPASSYPTAARRPRFTVLDSSTLSKASGRLPDDWRIALNGTMQELAHG